MRTRNYFTTLILCLICISAFAQENADSTIRKNKIKQVFIYEGKRVAGTRMYDEQGNLTFEFSNNMFGPITSTTKRGYKQSKLEWEKTKISTVKDTIFTIYAYDKAGNLTQVENGYAAKVNSAYEYDSLNRKTRDLIFNEGGPGTRDINYKYDEHGNLNEMLVNDAYIRNRKTRYIYDKANHLTRREVADNNGPQYTEEIKYDTKGHKVEETHTETDANEVTRYEYDKSGHLTQMTQADIADGKETISHTVKYTYNEYGLISTWEDSDMPGKVFFYKYEAW
jgi:YD repeat-containing protein